MGLPLVKKGAIILGLTGFSDKYPPEIFCGKT
jgi:hypothetical protein